MTLSTLSDYATPPMRFANDGTYYPTGQFPRTEGTPQATVRTPRVELRHGPLCGGCGMFRSTANRCDCNS